MPPPTLTATYAPTAQPTLTQTGTPTPIAPPTGTSTPTLLPPCTETSVPAFTPTFPIPTEETSTPPARETETSVPPVTSTFPPAQTATFTPTLPPTEWPTPTSLPAFTATLLPFATATSGWVVPWPPAPPLAPPILPRLPVPTLPPPPPWLDLGTGTVWPPESPTSTMTATSTPTSTPTPSPTPVPEFEKIFDDRDPAISYSAGWTRVEEGKAYAGTDSRVSESGSTATLVFVGHSFSLIYTGGPASALMDAYVDGARAASINEYAPEPGSQRRWDYAGQLAEAAHILTLVFVPGGPNVTGSVDAVIVRSFTAPKETPIPGPLTPVQRMGELGSLQPVTRPGLAERTASYYIRQVMRDVMLFTLRLIRSVRGW
ncbi:MAG: hypothetical protein ACM3QS_07960 [Bacteroidota bacterium]